MSRILPVKPTLNRSLTQSPAWPNSSVTMNLQDVPGGETRFATRPLSGLIVPRDRRSARDEVAGESQVVIEQSTSLYLSPLHSSTHLRHHAVEVGFRFRTIADQPLISCCSNLASFSIFGTTSGGKAPNSPAPCGHG
jgi:hypothetical protein